MTTTTQSQYEITPDAVVDLRDIEPVNPREVTHHRHVVVILNDGTEVWLDCATEADDHNHIDIRQFNTHGQMKGQGVFTIVNGRRQSLGTASIRNPDTGKWDTYEEGPLKDTADHPVTGHKWNGGYCITLLVEKDGDETAAAHPSQGNG